MNKIKSKEEALERFWSYVDKTDDCWNWARSKTGKGYGQFNSAVKYEIFDSKLTHRISYYLTYGEFDRRLDVCHKCDNPSCINPEHLFLGTRSDNMQDCADKGRLATQNNHVAKGEKSGRAKLTWEQVREIREIHASGEMSQRALGRKYGVDGKVINKIIHNKIWKVDVECAV